MYEEILREDFFYNQSALFTERFMLGKKID